jgi:membrane-bound lytic murein transglycosylase B
MQNHLFSRLRGRTAALQLATAGVLLLGGGSAAAPPPAEQQFVNAMAEQHGFDSAQLTRQLQQAQHRPSIIKAMSRPAEALPWHQYREIFLQPERIAAGKHFMRQHREVLQRAQQSYGVPPHIITAIIGVETLYGKNTGSYGVMEALRTLAFGYPRRAEFFRSELEHYLLMARDEGLSPLEPKGSYAGAMGMPQFMPSSFRSYAVDFDGDGSKDLWNSHADVIGSVANYLARHGWKSDAPVALKLPGKPRGLQPGNKRGQIPDIALGSITAASAELPPAAAAPSKAALLEFEQPDHREYWFGFHNFYVITRYNHSNLYAMAVYQLAQAVNQQSTE